MEKVLSDINATSKNLSEFKEMYEYENRLKTFKRWPFRKPCKCSPENMANAGFVHCPNVNEPDVAKCFFCLIELEGWESEHDPWLEHNKRSKDSCGFLSLSKCFDDLTVEEYYQLEMERVRIFLYKTGRSVIHAFEKEVALTRKRLVDHFVDKYRYTPELEKLAQMFSPCAVRTAEDNCVLTTKQKRTVADGEEEDVLLTSTDDGSIHL